MADIHNYVRRLKTTLKQVQESSISARNKKDIYDFHDFCFSQGIGAAKIQRYTYDLKKMAEFLKKDFFRCKRADMEKLMAMCRIYQEIHR